MAPRASTFFADAISPLFSTFLFPGSPFPSFLAQVPRHIVAPSSQTNLSLSLSPSQERGTYTRIYTSLPRVARFFTFGSSGAIERSPPRFEFNKEPFPSRVIYNPARKLFLIISSRNLGAIGRTRISSPPRLLFFFFEVFVAIKLRTRKVVRERSINFRREMDFQNFPTREVSKRSVGLDSNERREVFLYGDIRSLPGRKVVAQRAGIGPCNKRNVNFLALKLLFIDIRGNLGGEIKGGWLVGPRYSPETASQTRSIPRRILLSRSFINFVTIQV